MPFRIKSKLITIALPLAIAASTAGCLADSDPRVVPIHRFMDPQWRARAETNIDARANEDEPSILTASWPVMSLADEARYAVGSDTPKVLFYGQRWKNETGLPHVTLPVASGIFPPGTRVALQPKYSLGATRYRLDPSVATIENKGNGVVVSFVPRLPADHAKQRIGLHVMATAVPNETNLYYRLPAAPIPPNAYLAFSMGIQEPAWKQGPVEFEVQACVKTTCSSVFREVLDPANPDQRIWQPRRVELGAFAGKEVSFSFDTRLVSPSQDAFSLPGWGNPTVYARVPERKPGVNVIMISIDTLAAGHLPTYGYEHDTAPFLNGVLAKEGTVFEHAVAAATTTPQSHMSMFTSVQPCEHGLTTGMEQLRSQFVTLAEVLRAAGYETGAVTEDGWLGYEHGFGHGFNYYAENKSANVMAPDGQIAETLGKARSWIERNDDKAFFLFLHSFQVHGPYTPPKEYTELFREHAGTLVDANSPRELQEFVAYDQEIRYTDDELKAFFDFLRARGLLDYTVIVVTSDHGEEFLEHGEYGHGRNMFEQVTHVPLIVWGPGRVPQGRRDSHTVGHIDLMPTILALAGVEVPARATGRNVLSSVDSQSTAAIRFTESRSPMAIGKDFLPTPVIPPSFMGQQDGRKMARYRESEGFRYEAYDLKSDPHERSPLPIDSPEFASLKQSLDQYESDCAARMERQDESGTRELELDPERRDKLRALGYLQ